MGPWTQFGAHGPGIWAQGPKLWAQFWARMVGPSLGPNLGPPEGSQASTEGSQTSTEGSHTSTKDPRPPQRDPERQTSVGFTCFCCNLDSLQPQQLALVACHQQLQAADTDKEENKEKAAIFDREDKEELKNHTGGTAATECGISTLVAGQIPFWNFRIWVPYGDPVGESQGSWVLGMVSA